MRIAPSAQLGTQSPQPLHLASSIFTIFRMGLLIVIMACLLVYAGVVSQVRQEYALI
jgi:hypothetical protein